jgi:hypothetical protein
MITRTQRKNLIWDLMEKGHDTQFIFDYLLDHDHYWNIIR